MLRTVWGDDQRFIDTYWSRFPGRYLAGDGAKRADDGDLWLLGRVDDVMLVAGHNISPTESPTEVESALVSSPKVAERRFLGDVSTLQDATVMDLISAGIQGSGVSEDRPGTDAPAVADLPERADASARVLALG